jgi:hypothetical protein
MAPVAASLLPVVPIAMPPVSLKVTVNVTLPMAVVINTTRLNGTDDHSVGGRIHAPVFTAETADAMGVVAVIVVV